jgi:hypothetical protein
MNDRLRSAMNRLAAEGGKAEPPPELEAALICEFRRKQRRKTSSWIFVAGTIAASIVAALVTQNVRPLSPSTPSTPAVEEIQDSGQPFVGLPYITPASPYERIQVVRMEVSVAALIAAGLPMEGADPGARVEADVIVGQDGRARAVRLVSSSRLN